MSAPFCCLTHMEPYFYYNGFSDEWYKEFMEQYDFEILEMKRYGNFFQYLQQELERLNDVCKRYAHTEMSIDEIEKVYDFIKMLGNYSKTDSGSDELLRFGTLIEARKR